MRRTSCAQAQGRPVQRGQLLELPQGGLAPPHPQGPPHCCQAPAAGALQAVLPASKERLHSLGMSFIHVTNRCMAPSNHQYLIWCVAGQLCWVLAYIQKQNVVLCKDNSLPLRKLQAMGHAILFAVAVHLKCRCSLATKYHCHDSTTLRCLYRFCNTSDISQSSQIWDFAGKS